MPVEACVADNGRPAWRAKGGGVNATKYSYDPNNPVDRERARQAAENDDANLQNEKQEEVNKFYQNHSNINVFKESLVESFNKLTAEEIDAENAKVARGDIHWGYELLLDASGCNDNTYDANKVREFFDELIKRLDMKVLDELRLVKVDNEEGRGISATQMITTSSITFHGDEDGKSVYLDVFSCKPYEPQVALETFKRYFAPQHIGHRFIYRDAGPWPKKAE